MNPENLSLSKEIKQKNIIDMALTFTAMIRLFEKGSKPIIVDKLFDEIINLEKIINKSDFELFHKNFCDWFTSNIKTAKRVKDNKIVKESHFAYYGHASKLLDVSLKVIVYYTSLPNKNVAETILPFLNTGIDYPLLNYLKKKFPSEGISANTVEQIDRKNYEKLQKLISKDIEDRFNNEILPTQYDDIMWDLLNR